MGDRCWFSITIKKEDVEKFEKHFSPMEHYGADEEFSHDDQTITFDFYEANYGFYEEVEYLAQFLNFYGSHGHGGAYGSMEFVCFDQELIWMETGHEGGYVIDTNKDGEIMPASIEELRKFSAVEQQVKQYLAEDKKNTYPTIKESYFNEQS